MCFIDLPTYESMAVKKGETIEVNKNFEQLFKALEETDNLALFELPPIRVIIEHHWPLA